MQHAPAQEPSPAVHQMTDSKLKEIRDRFFSGERASEAPSRTQLPQPSILGQNSDKHDQGSASASPRDHMESNISALSQSSYGAMSNDTAGDDADARNKSKRELSTSKRAAQNRAAQRAFRQRKERYITELEEKVKQFATMEEDFRSLQDENHQLREYILNLQSQLLEQTRDQSSSPQSPPRKKRGLQPEDVDEDADREMHDRGQSAPRSPKAAQGEASTDGASYREHLDALRDRFGGDSAQRAPLIDDDSRAADNKRATNE